jgi:formate hydrogenlyase subunit 6/NADH:ubiquinone oxidoreductase subunit I
LKEYVVQSKMNVKTTDRADPILEHDCIWCMTCVSVCPPQAIKVDQGNVEAHENTSLD